MSDPTNSPDTPSAISSLASEAGPSPWPLPDGRVIDPCGLAAALANLSARQVKALGLQISGIYGLHGSTSSASARLQSSLASKLQQRLGTAGSIELAVTWKDAATPSGRPYCQRVQRVLSINADGSGSLPTPSGTSNHGRNHVSGRIDEWGASRNYFRGKPGGNEHLPSFELWTMGFPAAWRQLMPSAMRSSRKRPPSSSRPTPKREG